MDDTLKRLLGGIEEAALVTGTVIRTLDAQTSEAGADLRDRGPAVFLAIRAYNEAGTAGLSFQLTSLHVALNTPLIAQAVYDTVESLVEQDGPVRVAGAVRVIDFADNPVMLPDGRPARWMLSFATVYYVDSRKTGNLFCREVREVNGRLVACGGWMMMSHRGTLGPAIGVDPHTN